MSEVNFIDGNALVIAAIKTGEKMQALAIWDPIVFLQYIPIQVRPIGIHKAF